MTGRSVYAPTYAPLLIAAFEALSFDFVAAADGSVARGFAEDGVLEIEYDSTRTWFGDGRVRAKSPQYTARVSLMISTGSQDTIESLEGEDVTAVRCGVCLATVAEILRIDFLSWLGSRIHALGFDRPWRESRTFDRYMVAAEYFCKDVLVVTVVKSRLNGMLS